MLIRDTPLIDAADGCLRFDAPEMAAATLYLICRHCRLLLRYAGLSDVAVTDFDDHDYAMLMLLPCRRAFDYATRLCHAMLALRERQARASADAAAAVSLIADDAAFAIDTLFLA